MKILEVPKEKVLFIYTFRVLVLTKTSVFPLIEVL